MTNTSEHIGSTLAMDSVTLGEPNSSTFTASQARLTTLNPSQTTQTAAEPSFTRGGAGAGDGPEPKFLQVQAMSDAPLSITTTSLLTTSTDGHLTTVPVAKTIPNPTRTASPVSVSSDPTSFDRSAIIAGVISAVFIPGCIIVFFLFIKPCLRRRRQSREKVDLLERRVDHHGESPDMSDDTTAVTPFLISATRPASQQSVIHNYSSHPQSPSPGSPSHSARQSMTQSEEIRNQIMDISRRFDLNPLSTERSETPNPFADATVASESHVTPLPVGTNGPSPQLIDLIAERVVEMLRTQDPGFGGARSNMSPGNGGQAQVSRVSQLLRSDRSSTAPPTYATDEE